MKNIFSKNTSLQIRLTEYLFNIKKFDTDFIIAKVMLDKLLEFPDISIEEIAYLSNTTPPTVTKFCKKIGYLGFSQVKEETTEIKPNSFFISNQFQTAKGFYDYHVNRTKDIYESLYTSFDHQQIREIAKQLSTCKRVSVFTGLHGFSAANLFAEMMRQYEITVFEIDRSAEISVIESAYKFSDMIFIISLTNSWVTKTFSELSELTIQESIKKSILICHTHPSIHVFKEEVSLSAIPDLFDSNYISSQSLQAFFVLIASCLNEYYPK